IKRSSFISPFKHCRFPDFSEGHHFPAFFCIALAVPQVVHDRQSLCNRDLPLPCSCDLSCCSVDPAPFTEKGEIEIFRIKLCSHLLSNVLLRTLQKPFSELVKYFLIVGFLISCSLH